MVSRVLASPARATGIVRSLVIRRGQFPLVWMLIGVLGVGAVSALTAGGGTVLSVVGVVAAVAVYWAVMRLVARRRTPEIAGHHAGMEALFGGGIGLVFVAVSLIALVTEYSFTWSSGDVLSIVVGVVAVSVGAAVTEELLFRGLNRNPARHQPRDRRLFRQGEVGRGVQCRSRRLRGLPARVGKSAGCLPAAPCGWLAG